MIVKSISISSHCKYVLIKYVIAHLQVCIIKYVHTASMYLSNSTVDQLVELTGRRLSLLD